MSFWLIGALYCGYIFVMMTKKNKRSLKDRLLEFVFVPLIVIAIAFGILSLYNVVF